MTFIEDNTSEYKLLVSFQEAFRIQDRKWESRVKKIEEQNELLLKMLGGAVLSKEDTKASFGAVWASIKYERERVNKLMLKGKIDIDEEEDNE